MFCLAATAGTVGLTLVTADDRLLGLGKIAFNFLLYLTI